MTFLVLMCPHYSEVPERVHDQRFHCIITNTKRVCVVWGSREVRSSAGKFVWLDSRAAVDSVMKLDVI